jgi:hypothetical protein
MRLKVGYNPAAAALPGGAERRRDFRRVMSIIIHHENAVPFPPDLKSPVGVLKTGQRLGGFLKRHIQFKSRRNGGQRVERAMSAWNAEAQRPQRLSFMTDAA